MRFVNPRLTTGEHELPSEDDWRIDGFQYSLTTETMRSRGAISLCLPTKRMERGETSLRKHVHGITVGV